MINTGESANLIQLNIIIPCFYTENGETAMNKKYIIKKTPAAPGLDDSIWETAEKQVLDSFFDPSVNNPKVTVQVLVCDEGLSVRFESNEKDPTANYWTANQPAWLDSCAEFFFAPDASDPMNYLNFEQSVGGALLIQKGTQDDRFYIPHTDAPFKIEKKICDEGWKIKFFIPFSFVLKHYKTFDSKFKGNFQFCNEDKGVYITWNKIESPFPAFHRPAYFADIELCK